VRRETDRQGPVAGGPAGAVQRAVYGGDRGVELLGDLAGGKTEHRAQNQRSALPGRKVLQGRR